MKGDKKKKRRHKSKPTSMGKVDDKTKFIVFG